MKEYKVTIKGKTPYMQHRMDDIKLEEWEKNRGLIVEREDVNRDDNVRAEFHSYRDEDGFYMPTDHIRSAMINAGSITKSKVGNTRKSMKNIVAGMFFIKEDKLRLSNSYQIDKRSAFNRNIKGRVIVIRPKWENWKVTFTLQVDNDTINEETVKEIVSKAGNYIGIGSFRPESNGMFGRFDVEKFKKLS